MFIKPSSSSKQPNTIPSASSISISAGSLIVCDNVSVHPLSSVIITEYIPASKLSKSSDVSPLDHKYE